MCDGEGVWCVMVSVLCVVVRVSGGECGCVMVRVCGGEGVWCV